MKPMMACSTRPVIFQDTKTVRRSQQMACGRETYHCVLGAKVVDYEGTTNSPRHIEQTTEGSRNGGMVRPLVTYLITVAQPNTTLNEVLLPVMLRNAD